MKQKTETLPEILIVGCTGSGKSTIAYVIADALNACGIKTKINDQDGCIPAERKRLKETAQAQLSDLGKRVKSKININVACVNRKAFVSLIT